MFSFFKTAAKKGLFFAFLVFSAFFAWIYHLYTTSPDPSILKKGGYEVAFLLADAHQTDRYGNLVKKKSRLFVPLKGISKNLLKAVIVSEDSRFFQHEGIDFEEMKNSMEKNIEKKRFVRGGSTITQQLAKNLFLSREKSLGRKIREFFIARKMEEVLSKREILELYLNVIEWGPGIYGAESASRYYFKKSAASLSVEESAYLAAIIPNPILLPKKTKYVTKRQNLILSRMNKWGSN